MTRGFGFGISWWVIIISARRTEIESNWKLIFIDSRFQLAKSNSEKEQFSYLGKVQGHGFKNREKTYQDFLMKTFRSKNDWTRDLTRWSTDRGVLSCRPWNEEKSWIKSYENPAIFENLWINHTQYFSLKFLGTVFETLRTRVHRPNWIILSGLL